MASADVALMRDVTPDYDIPRISSFLQLPQKSIEDILALEESFFKQLLAALTTKAREHDELKADKLRKDVELEQSARTANVRNVNMKLRLDGALAEAQELREKVATAGRSNECKWRTRSGGKEC